MDQLKSICTKIFYKILTKISHAPKFWLIVGLIFTLFPIISVWSHIGIITVSSIAIGVLIVVLTRSAKDAKYERDIREKEKIIEKQEGAAFEMLKEVLKINLKEISSRLKFKQAQRICVYQYLRGNREFICVGRYSRHAEHSDYSARNSYPGNMGIISHVWGEGKHSGYKHDNNFPDYDEVSPEAYYKYIKEHYNIPQYTSKKFRMKSVDMIASVLYSAKGEPVAVIVFESEIRDVLDEVKIDKILVDESKNLIISSLLEIPTLNDR